MIDSSANHAPNQASGFRDISLVVSEIVDQPPASIGGSEIDTTNTLQSDKPWIQSTDTGKPLKHEESQYAETTNADEHLGSLVVNNEDSTGGPSQPGHNFTTTSGETTTEAKSGIDHIEPPKPPNTPGSPGFEDDQPDPLRKAGWQKAESGVIVDSGKAIVLPENTTDYSPTVVAVPQNREQVIVLFNDIGRQGVIRLSDTPDFADLDKKLEAFPGGLLKARVFSTPVFPGEYSETNRNLDELLDMHVAVYQKKSLDHSAINGIEVNSEKTVLYQNGKVNFDSSLPVEVVSFPEALDDIVSEVQDEKGLDPDSTSFNLAVARNDRWVIDGETVQKIALGISHDEDDLGLANVRATATVKGHTLGIDVIKRGRQHGESSGTLSPEQLYFSAFMGIAEKIGCRRVELPETAGDDLANANGFENDKLKRVWFKVIDRT